MHLESKALTEAKIDVPRGHSRETVERLREALASGAPSVPDTRRPDFFEVQTDHEVFYIHLSPITGRITLLATWAVEPEPELAEIA